MAVESGYFRGHTFNMLLLYVLGRSGLFVQQDILRRLTHDHDTSLGAA